MNRKLHEPIQQHIHQDLCNEINDVIIALKLQNVKPPFFDTPENVAQWAKILEARERHPAPDADGIIEFLETIRKEMNECTQPYKRHRHGR